MPVAAAPLMLGDASSVAVITGALAALLALLAGLLRNGRQPARVPVPVRNKRDRARR